MPHEFDQTALFRELRVELLSLQNRVRRYIYNGKRTHYPTDGAWKEHILREILRRHLPPSMSVASGFIRSTDGVSTQVDIIIYDDSGPALFRFGELVVVPPQIVRGVIEVKTDPTPAKLKEAFEKLNQIAEQIKEGRRDQSAFIGLFSYSGSIPQETELLETLDLTNSSTRPINALAIGAHSFTRFWPHNPDNGEPDYNCWHRYKLPGRAQGYFVHNVLDHIFPDFFKSQEDLWYPPEGKESGVLRKKEKTAR